MVNIMIMSLMIMVMVKLVMDMRLKVFFLKQNLRMTRTMTIVSEYDGDVER